MNILVWNLKEKIFSIKKRGLFKYFESILKISPMRLHSAYFPLMRGWVHLFYFPLKSLIRWAADNYRGSEEQTKISHVQHYRSINAIRIGAVWIFGFDSVIERVNSALVFTDLELNGMSSSDIPDVPPPLPLKGSMADYGNLMESQDLISPTTSPPAHQRVSPRDDDNFLQFSLLFYFARSTARCNPEISAVANEHLEYEGTASLTGTDLKGGWIHSGWED